MVSHEKIPTRVREVLQWFKKYAFWIFLLFLALPVPVWFGLAPHPAQLQWLPPLIGHAFILLAFLQEKPARLYLLAELAALYLAAAVLLRLFLYIVQILKRRPS